MTRRQGAQVFPTAEVDSHGGTVGCNIQPLGHSIQQPLPRHDGNEGSLLPRTVPGRAFSGGFSAFGDIVHQVIDMQGIAAGKDTGDRGHQPGIADGTFGFGIDGRAKALGQLVLRDEPDRKDEGIAFHDLFGAGDGNHALIHLGNFHRSQSILPKNAGDGMGEIKRDIVIMQALVDIAGEPGGGDLAS